MYSSLGCPYCEKLTLKSYTHNGRTAFHCESCDKAFAKKFTRDCFVRASLVAAVATGLEVALNFLTSWTGSVHHQIRVGLVGLYIAWVFSLADDVEVSKEELSTQFTTWRRMTAIVGIGLVILVVFYLFV